MLFSVGVEGPILREDGSKQHRADFGVGKTDLAMKTTEGGNAMCAIEQIEGKRNLKKDV